MMLSAQSPKKIRVLMVCLGNICRSPSAQGVLEKYVQDMQLEEFIEVDSAGTGDWHVGESPDPRSVSAAARRGYRIDRLIARQVSRADFEDYDYILAMDRTNLTNLREHCPAAYRDKLHLLLEYADSVHETVPDPYYSGAQGFELVLDLIEEACRGLLLHLREEHFPDHPVALP